MRCNLFISGRKYDDVKNNIYNFKLDAYIASDEKNSALNPE